MKIYFKDLKFYYLTVPKENNERKKHLIKEFKEFNLKEVNPIPYTSFNSNLTYHQRTRKSGATGFLKILDLASQEFSNSFKPFIIFEDDVKKTRPFPEFIEVPDNCDIMYLGLSQWGMTDKKNGINNSVCYNNAVSFNYLIKIYNMLSLHGIVVCSIRGLLSFQKCLLEDFHKNHGWDRAVAYMQPYLNVYALKTPLVYQYGKLGGDELPTKIDYKKLNNKKLPEKWKNRTNISIISNYKYDNI